MRAAAKKLRVDKSRHMGLSYQALAPTEPDGDDAGKVSNQRKESWFKDLTKSKPTPAYAQSFEAWQSTLSALGAVFAKAESTSPLLLGVGQPSATEVGLTIHPIWGVPYLPGTSLKGVLANYLMMTYGPEQLGTHPLDERHPEPDRAPYQGVSWREKVIQHGPGRVYRALFGAPSADSDEDYTESDEVGETVGRVIFHDALMVPLFESSDSPYMMDVVNPHLRSYYQDGKDPNDRDSPIPVFFLTVRPKLSFMIALGGDESLHELTHKLLCDALAQWGIGAKTRAGYGRLKVGELTTELYKAPKLSTPLTPQNSNAKAQRGTSASTSQPDQSQAKQTEPPKPPKPKRELCEFEKKLEALLDSPTVKEMAARERITFIKDHHLEALNALPEEERRYSYELLKRALNKKPQRTKDHFAQEITAHVKLPTDG